MCNYGPILGDYNRVHPIALKLSARHPVLIMHPQTKRKLPARFDPMLFAFLLSGLMSLRVSGVVTWQSLGFRRDVGTLWLAFWLSSWLIAFAAAMVVTPMVRRLDAHSVCPRS